MTMLKTQAELETQAADSRFFIAREHQPNGLILDLIGSLDAFAEISGEAKAELSAVSDEEYTKYMREMSALSHGAGAEAQAVVGRMQDLLERAHRHSDAVAAIQKSGHDLAAHLCCNLTPPFRSINGNFYWIGKDHRDVPYLCGVRESDTTQDQVYFGTLTDPSKVEGYEARLEDYAKLIMDVHNASQQLDPLV